MPNPTPQYRVKFDGNFLPGYAQLQDIPLDQDAAGMRFLNRDGGSLASQGYAFRTLSLQFRVLTRVENTDGLTMLGDCIEQYREALRYSTRVASSSTIFLGDANHYLVGTFRRASAPLSAPDHRAVNYQMDFEVNPWFYGTEVESVDSISGNDSIVLNMPDTRKTYPTFRITSGISGITISHSASGKSMTLAGTHGTLNVDCGTFVITDGNNLDYSNLTSTPDFGMYHVGSGTATFSVTGVTGSGTVTTRMKPRLEI